ncbi:MAG: GntR family transcriptional regulator [Legionellaceae bacterium]|nr:GntR family transcriptional regulator [Legionellaceae bacterium]
MNFSKNKAIYIQISDYVCDEILKHRWALEEKVPSIREMAVLLEVNPNTVVRAYAELEQQGIIAMKRGIGYFVAPQAKRKILEAKKATFLKETLPRVFNTMQLLEIDISELNNLYQKREKS